MEEVRTSASPDEGRFPGELPEPFVAPLETSHGIAYEATPNTALNSAAPNTAPRPETRLASTALNKPESHQTEANKPPIEKFETDFEKRNERLRHEPKQQDELAAAGMVALGDVIRDRQAAYALPTPVSGVSPLPAQSQFTLPQQAASTPSQSLYRQAIVVGLVAALIMAPVMILVIARS